MKKNSNVTKNGMARRSQQRPPQARNGVNKRPTQGKKPDQKASRGPAMAQSRMVCEICRYICKNEMLYKKHMLWHKKIRRKSNIIYGLQEELASAVTHLEYALEEQNFYGFTAEDQIENNFLGFSSEDTMYFCIKCHKLFRSTPDYKDHLLLHSRKQLFECNVCGKTYDKQDVFRDHRLFCQVKAFQCTDCDLEFNDLSSWEVHYSHHTKQESLEPIPMSRSLSNSHDVLKSSHKVHRQPRQLVVKIRKINNIDTTNPDQSMDTSSQSNGSGPSDTKSLPHKRSRKRIANGMKNRSWNVSTDEKKDASPLENKAKPELLSSRKDFVCSSKDNVIKPDQENKKSVLKEVLQPDPETNKKTVLIGSKNLKEYSSTWDVKPVNINEKKSKESIPSDVKSENNRMQHKTKGKRNPRVTSIREEALNNSKSEYNDQPQPRNLGKGNPRVTISQEEASDSKDSQPSHQGKKNLKFPGLQEELFDALQGMDLPSLPPLSDPWATTTSEDSDDGHNTCSECGITFRTTADLKRHSLTHKAIRPYKCKMCGHVCKKIENIRRHFRDCPRRTV